MNKLDKYKLCGEVRSTISGKLLYLILCELANKNGEVVISQRKISRYRQEGRTNAQRLAFAQGKCTEKLCTYQKAL